MYSILTCAVFDLHSIYCLRNRPAYRPHPQTTSTNEQKWILYFWSDIDYIQQSLGSGDWEVGPCQLIASNALNDRRLPQLSALTTSAHARRTGLQLHGLFLCFIVILHALNEALIRGWNASAKKLQIRLRSRPRLQSAQHWLRLLCLLFAYCTVQT